MVAIGCLACASVRVADGSLRLRRYFRLEQNLAPFMFEVPRAFGGHEALLKQLGTKETVRVYSCAHVCVRACVCACVRLCVHAL